MTVLEAFLQGLLQGFTEFLPVSSSGHLSLFQYFTGNSGESAFLFSILLHAGTLVAVCIVFWKTILTLAVEFFALLSDLIGKRFLPRDMRPERRMLLLLLVSLLPLFGMLLLKDLISGFSSDNDITVEGFCFLLTGITLLFASRHDRGRKDARNMTRRDALVIGAAQAVATMPGISRSGSTISAGMLCGLNREYVVSYSFILGIPAVLGAIVLEVKDALQEGLTLPLPVVLTGFFSAVVFGILSIKLVQWVVRGNKLKYFGYYTLGLGLLVIVIGMFDHLTGHILQQMLVG
ncbi:MAG: undecaprenyl-diphosphate phosphatase [Anaerotruncus sp.]|nr:undecaprenyl-diphosphate phosphatase [Anaerotruncus sp.]